MARGRRPKTPCATPPRSPRRAPSTPCAERSGCERSPSSSKPTKRSTSCARSEGTTCRASALRGRGPPALAPDLDRTLGDGREQAVPQLPGKPIVLDHHVGLAREQQAEGVYVG